MNQFDLIVVEKVTEEFMSGETKSALEEGSQHHNLVGVGSRDIFILSRPPLENDTGGEKVILEKLEEPVFINGSGLEHFWERSNHGREGESLSAEWVARAEEEEDSDN
jgi:hypothetical protein